MKNKKKWLIIVIIFILMVIPVPTGVYKDGGTRTYTALTYKIVDWNHIYGEDGSVYDEMKVYPFPMNFMSLDALFYREEKQLDSSDGKNNTEEIGKENNNTDRYQKNMDFTAQYIRTDGYHEDVEYPVVKVIHSVEELQAYYETNKNLYDLERRTDVASDYTIGFLDACDKYDATYFEEQVLIMVLLEEPSGSNRHQVKEVRWNETEEVKQMRIEIESVIPEVGTEDMAEWHILIEPKADVAIEASDIKIFLDGINVTDKSTIASYSKGYANMSLQLPQGWAYEVYDEDIGFGIYIWPKNYEEGKLRLEYFADGFGVCGTGLEEEKITLNGYEAYKGTYDNRKVWDFIIFQGTPGDYAVINEGGDAWWEEYGEEAMNILSTVTLGKDIIDEEEAIAAAKKEVTVEYNQIRAVFDYENGIWKVMFSKNYTAGGDQVMTMDTTGNIIDMVYGE